MRTIVIMLVTGVLFLSLTACDEDDDGVITPGDATLAELTSGDPDLSTLADALDRAGLMATLANEGPFTVLAPTNDAFADYLAGAGFASIGDVPVAVLQQLLLNHVINGGIGANELATIGKSYTETLADGAGADTQLAIYFDATGGGVTFNGQSDVITPDIGASNGVVHIVDEVIDLPTIFTFVTADDELENLALALTTATPNTDFETILNAEGPYTLFAPDDEAFVALLDSNPDWETLEDIEEATLIAVLQHHAINGNVRAASITDNSTAASLEGDDLTFSTSNGVVDITDASGNMDITVTTADIQSSNGVIHIIEAVLIPDITN